MNGPLVTIVPLYALVAAYGHVKLVLVCWFYKVEARILG